MAQHHKLLIRKTSSTCGEAFALAIYKLLTEEESEVIVVALLPLVLSRIGPGNSIRAIIRLSIDTITTHFGVLRI